MKKIFLINKEYTVSVARLGEVLDTQLIMGQKEKMLKKININDEAMVIKSFLEP